MLEPYYETPHTDLYAVKAGGGDAIKITGLDGGIEQMALSPDGARMAITGSIEVGKDGVERSYSQPDLFMTSLQPGSRDTPKNLTASYDFDIGGGVGGDGRRASARRRAGDVASLIEDRTDVSSTSMRRRRRPSNLKRIDAETGKVEIVRGRRPRHLRLQRHAGKAALLISTPTNIGDLYILDISAHLMSRLTNINEELFSKLNLTEPVMIWYKTSTADASASVQRYTDFQEGKKCCLFILNIHGGPHAAYGYTFDHEIQWMAAKGYVVLYPHGPQQARSLSERQAIAGEWGHTSITPAGPLCYCGQRGCVETALGGGGVEARWRGKIRRKKIVPGNEKDFYAGDAKAVEFMKTYFRNFGRALANVIDVLGP